MAAFCRPQRREVSTSSAAITRSGWDLNSPEPGKIANLAPARAEVVAPVGVAQPDVGEQAGEQRLVDPVGVGRRRPAYPA